MAVKLTKKQVGQLNNIATGGEAAIYAYKGNTVLKIFLDTDNLSVKQQKVEAMLRQPPRTGLVLPTDIVLVDGKFAGYQMPNIPDGEPLHSYTKARFVRDHKLCNYDALQIVTQLAHLIDQVHADGFVIGDVSDNNFLASLSDGHPTYMIDVDSWGLRGLEPDAYTETFTPPESYNGNGQRKTLNVKTDCFGFTVLAFNVLTRIHPFGGTYQKSPNMNTVERIKQKISLLGQHDIVYNKTLFNWSWMSPDLLKTMQATFEGSQRKPITGELDDQLQHSKHCKIHNVYYYDRYTECPLCAGVAKLKKVVPVVVKATQGGPQVVVVFSNPDIHMMIDENSYFDNSGNIVYVPTMQRLPRQRGAMMHFASKGRFLVSVTKTRFSVLDVASGKVVADIDRWINSAYDVQGANILYIDRNGQIHKMLLSASGLQDGPLFQSSNALLSLNELGETFVVNQYRDRALVSYKDHDVDIQDITNIQEYAIKYDQLTKTWLFIYETSNGAFRTMVFGEQGKEYDDTVVRYTATPLSNVCYYNRTVYDPGVQTFTGTNLKTAATKIFQCAAVDETCALKFDGKAFTIVSETAVHRFG